MSIIETMERVNADRDVVFEQTRRTWAEFEEHYAQFQGIYTERPELMFSEALQHIDEGRYALGVKMVEAIKTALIVDGFVHPKKLEHLLRFPRTPTLKLMFVHNGFKDEKKICMLDIRCSDYRVRLDIAYNSTSLNVKPPSRQQ